MNQSIENHLEMNDDDDNDVTENKDELNRLLIPITTEVRHLRTLMTTSGAKHRRTIMALN